MVRRFLSGAVIALACTSPAFAGGPGRINAREHRQVVRIQEGVRDGSVTRAEQRRLVTEQRAIRAEERVYRRGGLTPWERRDLQRDLNRASRDIYRQKHDGRIR
jgi:hypothetical protein